MRIGVLSDTHNQLLLTIQAIEMLRIEGAEAIIHCGDITDAPIIEACAVLPLWFVFGNHDADNVPVLEEVARKTRATCLGWWGTVEMYGHEIAVAHGHRAMTCVSRSKVIPTIFSLAIPTSPPTGMRGRFVESIQERCTRPSNFRWLC